MVINYKVRMINYKIGMMNENSYYTNGNQLSWFGGSANWKIKISRPNLYFYGFGVRIDQKMDILLQTGI